jgi:hypothetical protein
MMEQLSRSQLPKNALRSRRWAHCRLSRFHLQHPHRLGNWHRNNQSLSHESLSSPTSQALSRCISHRRSRTTTLLFTSRFLVLTTRRPLLWLLLAREAIPGTEAVREAEHHDMLHLLIPEVAEVEMDRAASRLRVSTMLPFPPVQTLQDVAIEEAEEAMDRTGIATFLHLSTPNSNTYPAEV